MQPIAGQKFHIAGVAGVGMSALAEALLDAGALVSGSDRRLDNHDTSPVVDKLVAQGLTTFRQDGSAITPDLAALVVSSAIEETNAEVLAARRWEIPIRHRAAVLAALTSASPQRNLIAVAGTSGKSTTTAILGAILTGCGLDPLVINGAPVIDWRDERRCGSVRNGQGDWCVIEVDESDRSLLHFHPRHAIITNASADHFPLPETLELFAAFRSQVSGIVIDGIADDTPAPPGEPLAWGSRFRWQSQDYAVALPGRHNVVNAWQAVRLALALGLPAAQIAAALSAFKGVERRLELVGWRLQTIPVIDDYAHNTEKLRAVWQTLAAGHRRVLGLWRPHGYGPLRAMLDELGEMFAATLRPDDILYLLPVYDAGGTANRSIDSGALAERLHAAGTKVVEVASHQAAISQMTATARAGDILATLGARDPELPRTARKLAATQT